MKDRPNLVVGETHLSRDLKEFDITMIGVGAMIGAGIFVLTGSAAGTAGPALLLAFALNAVVTIFTAMVYAELGSAIPEAGGGYLWIKDSMGNSQGFLAGWMSWFSHAVAGALYALGFGSYFALLLKDLHLTSAGIPHLLIEKGLAILVVVLFVGINFRGTSETGKAGNIVTLAKLGVIGLFVAAGLWAMATHRHLAHHFEPFFPKGTGSIFLAMGFTYIAFEGYEIIVQAGEEVENPRRSIPRAVFWSLIIVAPIYVLVGLTALGAIQSTMPSWQFLGKYKELGLVEAARQFMPFGTYVLLVGGLLSTVSALNATTYSSTRVAFAMGRDKVLPAFFAKVHSRNKTPYLALLVTSVIMLLMVLLVPIDDVATAADVMFLLLFIQVNYAVIRIRREFGDRLEYGYLVPFYPWVPILGMGFQAFLAVYLFRFSPKAWFLAAGWIVAGLGVFFAYVRGRVEEEDRPRIARKRVHRAPGLSKRERILVAIDDPERSRIQIRLAAALARAEDAEVMAVNVVQVPRQTPLRSGKRLPVESETMLDALEDVAESESITVRAYVAVGRSVSGVLREAVEATGARALILGWHGQVYERRIKGSIADAVLRDSPGDVLIVKDRGLPDRVGRVTLAIAPGAQEKIALATAASLARGLRSTLRIVSFRGENPPENLEDWFAGMQGQAREAGIAAGNLDAEIRGSESFIDDLVDEADASDVFVMGAAQDWVSPRHLLGKIPDTVANRSEKTVVVVKQEEARVISLTRRVLHLVRRRY